MPTLWISHRGESADAPENTLSAFRLAMERDTDGMECDIHLTADGEVAVCHDAATGRTGSQDRIIAECTLAELKTLDMSNGMGRYAGERLPALAEALRVLRPGKTFLIEAKGDAVAILPPLDRLLTDAAVDRERIYLISFSRDIIREAQERLPGVRTLWLTTGMDEEERSYTPDQLIAILRRLGAAGVDAACHRHIVTRTYVEALHRAGFAVGVWTVDDPESGRYFHEIGVDMITSNRAMALRREVAGT